MRCVFTHFFYAISMIALTFLSGCGSPDRPAASTGTGPQTSGSVELHGAGATFPAPLYAKWTSEFNKLHPNVKVDYQAIGSGGGIKGITDRTVQFAGSDAPMTEEQLKAVSGPVLHLPTVAGPVVIVYNLPEIKTLTLSGEVLAEIFLGKITKWNDPKIAAANSSAKLPATDIVVAHRSDGSGTTWIFTNYLSKISPEWSKSVGNATSVKWPTGLGGKGNDGVAQSVQNAAGGIGYVELAYAQNAKLPYAMMINKAGKAVEATIDGVVEAAKNSAEIPADMRVSITDAPGDAAYPICGYTYLLVYEDLTYLKNKDQEAELVNFINWCIHDGQSLAKPAYAPLSAELQKKVEAAVKTLKIDGK
jgi:phosphate transport system substrate-binding protein